jgi:hypothetical protein
MLIILTLYIVLVWLLFWKLKLVKWGWVSGAIAVLVGADAQIDASIRRPAMTLRRLLVCCIGSGAASLMVGTLAIAEKDAGNGELGRCAAYSGVPSEDNDTAGMVFIRGGTFASVSARRSASPTSCASTDSGSIATR